MTRTSRPVPARAPGKATPRFLRAIVALVGALALAGIPALTAVADPAPPDGTVTVTVTDGIGGPTLSGKTITLMGSSMNNLSGTSDSNGQYTFTGVSDDTYSISVIDVAGVYMNAVSDHFDVGGASSVITRTVALSHFPTGTGVVTGRLVDKRTGSALSGVTVSIGGGVTRIKNATTDVDGTFSFDSLPVDVDFVMAFATGYASYQFPAVDVNNDTTDMGVIRFAPLTSTISGRVTDPDGQPVADMPIDLIPAAGQPDVGQGSAQTDSNGYYTTSWNGSGSLAAGSYTISTGLHGTVYAAQNIPVTVPDDANLTVNISLVPRLSGIVVGNVEDAQGAPLQGICVFAVDPATRQPEATDITDANGTWSFSDLTVGSYLFRMRSCENPVRYGASYLGGTTPATATVVEVHAGDELAYGSTTLLPDATISGHVDVVTPTGTAPMPFDRGVIVQTLQLSGGDWVVFDADTADVVGTNGDFTVGDLPAGSYRVEFFDQLTGKRAYATQYWSQSTTSGSPTLDGASTITLTTGGARTGVDAHLSTVHPADVPNAVTTASLASGDEKTLTVSDTVAPGQRVTVSLGADHAGEWVSVWGHSTPTLLADWVEVSAAGTVEVTVPTTFPSGSHRLVAQTADGTVIGWEPLTVSDAVVVTPPASSVPLLPSNPVAITPSRSTGSAGSASATGSEADASTAASAASPTPAPSATDSSAADSSSSSDASGGTTSSKPVLAAAPTGLPIWLLVLIVGLGALLVASVIIVIARRARA